MKREDGMDFIERIFGIAPDGGDGTFELALFAMAIVLVGMVLFLRKSRLRA